MGISSLQVCMDSLDWLQGTIQETESSGCQMLDSSISSPSAAEMLAACSRPSAAAAVAAAALIDGGRRLLRPPHDHAIKCPRCESSHTKFCYYNNYSLSQPRYFCKTCRRYWTKGGTLRNIPVGGGCRKNKKPSSSSSAKRSNDNNAPHSESNYENAQGQMNLPQLMGGNNGFLDAKYGGNVNLLFPQNPNRPIDFLDNKIDYRGLNNDLGMVNPGFNGVFNNGLAVNNEDFRANYSPYGLLSLEINNDGEGIMDAQRLMLSSSSYDHQDQNVAIEIKPNRKILSLDWQQDQGFYNQTGKDGVSYKGGGYNSGLGTQWNNGTMNCYGSSTRTTNSLM